MFKKKKNVLSIFPSVVFCKKLRFLLFVNIILIYYYSNMTKMVGIAYKNPHYPLDFCHTQFGNHCRIL